MLPHLLGHRPHHVVALFQLTFRGACGGLASVLLPFCLRDNENRHPAHGKRTSRIENPAVKKERHGVEDEEGRKGEKEGGDAPVLVRRGCNLSDQGVVVLAGVSVLGLH